MAYLASIGFSSCEPKQPPVPSDPKDQESSFDSFLDRGVLQNSLISEASGITYSVHNPGGLWVINDSGLEEENKVYFIDSLGRGQDFLRLEGIRNYDFEAISTVQSANGKTELFVGDIGDNFLNRASVFPYRIYWFEEPEAGQTNQSISGIKSITINYPNGESIDSESMLIDQSTKDIFLFSKAEKEKRIFKILGTDLIDGKTVVPIEMGNPVIDKPFSTMPDVVNYYSLTDAAISPDNTEILLRTYGQIYYWKKKEGETIDQAIKRQPRIVPSNSKYSLTGTNAKGEPQGEGICFEYRNLGYYTISEQLPTHLYFFRKK